jgi:hypothetical protein
MFVLLVVGSLVEPGRKRNTEYGTLSQGNLSEGTRKCFLRNASSGGEDLVIVIAWCRVGHCRPTLPSAHFAALCNVCSLR